MNRNLQYFSGACIKLVFGFMLLFGFPKGVKSEEAASPPILDLIHNPFNKWSAHHRPIGANAEAGVPGGTLDPRASNPIYDPPGPLNSRGRLDRVGTFRIGTEFKPILEVSSTDPFKIITATPGEAGTNLPTPAPGIRFPHDTSRLPKRGDGVVGFYPRNGGEKDLLDVFFQFRYPQYTATRRASYPLAGTDAWEDPTVDRSPGASAIRIPSGVLLGVDVNDTNPKPITHALNATATRHCGKGAPPSLHVLNRKMVWPAYSTDKYKISPEKDPEKYDNQGDLPYGTVIFIRPQDRPLREKLGLNDRQKAIFDVLCYYGCRLVDGQGAVEEKQAVLQIRTDGEISKSAANDVNEALQKILPHLYPLRNPRGHTEESEVWKDGLPYVGGGGPIDPEKSVNSAWDAKPAGPLTPMKAEVIP